MEQCYGKKYKLKSSENFEEYMKFIEIGYLSRKAALAVSPVSMLTKNDDGSFTMLVTTPIKNVQITFRLGQEFEEQRADGVKVKSLIVMEGNKLVQTQLETNGRKSTFEREFTPEQMVVTSTAEGWNGSCIRVYEAI